MAIQIRTQNRSEVTERNSSGETALGLAVIGCFVAGAIGLVKASEMENGFGVLLCLLGSVFAFGTVFYIYLGKR